MIFNGSKIQVAVICTDLLDFKRLINLVYARKGGFYSGNSTYVINTVSFFAVMYDEEILKGRELQAVLITDNARAERKDLEKILSACYMRLNASGIKALRSVHQM